MGRSVSTHPMPSAYDPSSVEGRLYAEWVGRGYFGADPRSKREPFCVVLPPPNVTGVLHIGHALDHTVQDVIVRRRRMQGSEALWLPGTDHAGIATQVVVERELRSQGIEPRDLGRDAFVDRVWQWKEQYGGRIVEQMKALGSSCDWGRLRFTMDERLSQAVRVAFVRMYEDGLIYRGERIINWCPTDRTALSDSELEHLDVEGELVTFGYPLSDGDGHVDVATTRVETMLGDTGVAVHPKDRRYKELVGRTVRHPFTGEDLPVVADEAVDPEFGTGAVKVTPAHDPTDFEIAERTGLPALNILNADATISDAAAEEFRGLDRHEARARVLEALRGRGLIVAEERPYVHAVGHCYRCGSEVEPWLSGKQWFVAVDRLKGPARKAAEDGRVRFFPERWVGPYTAWMDNLRDWNISRQLWWGHRIPVWYCGNGHEFAALEDPSACAECGTEDIEQDPDVLDTWFSSQLWPFSTLGWPDDTDDLGFFYPTSVLVTGYEILYLWVARMIMSGLYLAGDVPFGHVVIHGLVRDRRGRKMSKSLGNVIDPLDMIERYGADALRFSLARMASPEQQNLPLAEEAIQEGRHFANKIWNAARLVLSSDGAKPELPDELTLADRWLLSRLEACRSEVDAALEEYRLDSAAQALYRFFWSEYCDWGLEVAKPRLYEGDERERADAASVLAWVLERSLRLLHPMMPFVTEEIWRQLDVGDSIVVSSWPEPSAEHRDEDAERRFGAIQAVVTEARNLGPSIAMGIGYERHVDTELQGVFAGHTTEIEALTGLRVSLTADTVRLTRSDSSQDVDKKQVEQLVSSKKKRISQLDKLIRREEGKLANPDFLAKASKQAVEKAQGKLMTLKEERLRAQTDLERLGQA